MPELVEARLDVVLGAQQVTVVARRQGAAHGLRLAVRRPGAGPARRARRRAGRACAPDEQLGVPLHGDDVVARPLQRLDGAVGAAGGHHPPVGDAGRPSGGAAS